MYQLHVSSIHNLLAIDTICHEGYLVGSEVLHAIGIQLTIDAIHYLVVKQFNKGIHTLLSRFNYLLFLYFKHDVCFMLEKEDERGEKRMKENERV